jgi:hypothetical protein
MRVARINAIFDQAHGQNSLYAFRKNLVIPATFDDTGAVVNLHDRLRPVVQTAVACLFFHQGTMKTKKNRQSLAGFFLWKSDQVYLPAALRLLQRVIII